ncbi:MAG: hypothetical protein NXI24_12265 [bacterium]|nr:hypothetical protein [bacterium]
MRRIHQTDFSAARGNALQACFASIFDLGLADVPNFLEAAEQAGVNYLEIVDDWLAERGLVFLKIGLPKAAEQGRVAGSLEFPAGPAVCVLAGPSPRGDFKHAVVGRVQPGSDKDDPTAIGTDFTILHDPHPDDTGLAGPPVWVGFFALRETK